MNVTKVVFDDSFKNYSPKICSSWFEGFSNLTEIVNIKNFNTSSVTNMGGLFCGCYKLKSIDLSSFNTENVEDMTSMFTSCGALKSINLSTFNTKKVNCMKHMFANCVGLKNLDLSNFNTESLESLWGMFYGANRLETIDLSNFNTSKIESFSNIFNNCSNLTKIYVGKDWTTKSAKNDEYSMFFDCPNLVGGKGTMFNPEKVTYEYAKIDGGESAPGYFTEKNSRTTSLT